MSSLLPTCCRTFSRQLLSVALLLPALILFVGCTDGNVVKDVVSGPATYGDEPMAGTVVFVGADGKKLQGPILDGKYKVENAPKGKYKVYIEAVPGMGGGEVPKDGAKDAMATMKGGGKKMGVAPHADYTKVETSGLEVDVTGGKQEWPIKLTKK